MNKTISKLMMAFLAIALAFAAIPVTNAYAADDAPPAKGEVTDEKLADIWVRQAQVYERLGKAFEDTEARIAKFQGMIDKAASNDKDVTNLQAALDAYEAALLAAKPQYEALEPVFQTHSGFDANGKVTDSEKAKATIKEARDGMKSIKDSMGGTFKALREAIKAFREANKPTQETSGSSNT